MDIKDIIFDIFKELKYSTNLTTYKYKCRKITLYDLLLNTHEGSPYHKEGSFLKHLEMVYDISKIFYDLELSIACLLHDIGKPFCRFYDTEKNVTRFNGHESLSVFIAIDVLDILTKDEKYKDIDKIRILKLIQRHADPYKFSKEKLLKLYTKSEMQDVCRIHFCDTKGRLPEKEPTLIDISDFEFIKEPKYTSSKMFVVLHGVPCSGKSTYIETLNKSENLTEYEKNFKDFRVLSRDEIVMKFAELNNLTYKKSFDKFKDKINKEYQKRFSELKYCDIIVDGTNISEKSRRKFKNRNVLVITFLVGFNEIFKRNSKRLNKKLENYVIINFMKNFQFVYSGEGFVNTFKNI